MGTLFLYSFTSHYWNFAYFSSLSCDKAFSIYTFFSALFLCLSFVLYYFFSILLFTLSIILSCLAATFSSILAIFACLSDFYLCKDSNFCLITNYFSGLWPWFTKISSATFLYWSISSSIVTFVFSPSFFILSIVYNSRSSDFAFTSSFLPFFSSPFFGGSFYFYSSFFFFPFPSLPYFLSSFLSSFLLFLSFFGDFYSTIFSSLGFSYGSGMVSFLPFYFFLCFPWLTSSLIILDNKNIYRLIVKRIVNEKIIYKITIYCRWSAHTSVAVDSTPTSFRKMEISATTSSRSCCLLTSSKSCFLQNSLTISSSFC